MNRKKVKKYISAICTVCYAVISVLFPYYVDAYPATSGGGAPYIEAANGNASTDAGEVYRDNTIQGIELALEGGASSISVDVLPVYSQASEAYITVLCRDAYVDINSDGISELICSNNSAADQASAEGIGLVCYEDLSEFYAVNGYELLTIDSFLDYMTEFHPDIPVDFRLSWSGPDEITAVANSVLQHGMTENTMVTADGNTLEEIQVHIQSILETGLAHVNLDLSALSYLLLGNEGTPGNKEDAVAFSRYLTEEGISVLSQADSVMFPSATLECCQSQYGDFVNNFHALGIAVGADISADTAYAGSLAKAGTDILRTSAPGAVSAALQEPAPVQIASLEVTFDGNGAEDNSFGSQTYTTGVEGQMFSGSISKSGHIMLGWVENLDQPDPIYATNSTVSDDWIIGKNEQGITSITLYAYWQEIPVHTVVFDLNGQGEEQQIQDLMDGEIAVRPEDPASPAGLIFTGWYLDPEAVNKYDFSSPVTSDMVLYAAWLQPEPEEQEELPLPDEHQALEPEPAPEIPEPELPSAEITVTFEGNGATDNTFAVQTFRQGNESQSFTGTIARNGYIMRGWAETPDSLEPQYPVNAEISDAWIVSKAQDNSGMLTLYAVWEQTTPGNVNIVFDTQGHGGTIQTMVIPVGSTVSMPEDPSEQGYLFMGWFTDPQFMQPFDISAPVTTNLVLYALWIPEPAYYIVSFDMQGHGTSPVAQTVEAGTAAERPVPDPAETGWLFLGWYTGPDLITAYDFSASVYADTIVYAGWREIVTQIPQQTDMNNPAPDSSSSSGQMQSSTTTELPVQYTVTFNMMGYGDQIATLSVAAGRPAQRPSDPMEKGYTFQGWYLEDRFVTAYDFSQPVVSDLQLFARWDKIVPETLAETEIETEVPMYCTVSFSTGSGQIIEPQVIKTGGLAICPEQPQAKKHVFEGWYSDAEYTVLYDFASPVVSDLTLYAKWRPIYPDVTYTVSFVSENIVFSKQYVHAGSLVTKPVDPSKKGYAFIGWFKDNEQKHKYSFSNPVTANMTLYAGWSLRTEQPPRTGDESGFEMYSLLILGSAATVFITIFFLRRQKNKESSA